MTTDPCHHVRASGDDLDEWLEASLCHCQDLIPAHHADGTAWPHGHIDDAERAADIASVVSLIPNDEIDATADSRRVFPGAEFDHLPVLHSDQGGQAINAKGVS